MVPATGVDRLLPVVKLNETLPKCPSWSSSKQVKLVKKYYDNQQHLATVVTNDITTTEDPKLSDKNSHGWKKDRLLAQLTVLLNIGLMFALIVAFALSHSMAILATAVDAAADLTSGKAHTEKLHAVSPRRFS